jgi:hypothetical protein
VPSEIEVEQLMGEQVSAAVGVAAELVHGGSS